jgi:hypothetical protein
LVFPQLTLERARFYVSYVAYRDTAPKLATLVNIARQPHHARLPVSGFAVAISSARLGSILPRTVAVHRHCPLRWIYWLLTG